MPETSPPPPSSSPPQAPPRPPSILTQPVGAPSNAHSGAGMDRRVAQPVWTRARIGGIAGGVLLAALLAWAVASHGAGQRLRADAGRLTVATAERGPFQEYVAVTGTLLPARTVYLDAVVGGQVEERFVEEGAFVEAGQAIVRLSNDDLTLQMLSSEAQLAQQLNEIRTTRLALDQNALDLAQQMTELDYNLTRLGREHDRAQALHDGAALARQEYEAIRDEYAYMQRRRELTQQGHRQDSLVRAEQVRQMDGQVGRLRQNLGLVRRSMDNLVIRAPIAGQLSLLDAEVGESRPAGSRIGQVDADGQFQVRAAIDEFYITRVARGQTALAEVGGASHALAVRRVYPEVRDGRFEVAFAFEGAEPDGLRRGQSLRLRLALGDSEEALLLPRGAFFQQTGGAWAYVLDESGDAVRRPVRLGRQNPQQFEVMGGLQPGDRVVISSYDSFGDADRLVLR